MPVEPMPPVVVGLDGSAASLAALDLGAEEAVGRVTPLEIVYVHRRTAESTMDEETAALARAGDTLAAAIGRVGADHPGLAVRGVFALGDPVEELVAHMKEACLAVIGCRGLAGSGTVGPVALQVAHRAPVPVIVTRPFDREHAGAAPRPILLGVDGLPCSEDAVAFGFEEASLRGAPIEVHHVWWRPPAAGIACCFPEAFYADGADMSQARAEARRMLADTIATWSAKLPDVRVHPLVDGGCDPVATLLAASHEAQLVVVGAHSHPGLAHLLSSTVSQVLLERAGCSVAITQGG